MLRMPFDSPEARGLNTDIFETIYFAAMDLLWNSKREWSIRNLKGSPVSKVFPIRHVECNTKLWSLGLGKSET